ncbi:hypothetical protein Btru_004653 [Bulinus truncatus]|nr:hypothetical protein Btru_004653 [Bulinus truncatus]
MNMFTISCSCRNSRRRAVVSVGHQQQSDVFWATNNIVLYSGPPTTECSILGHQQQSPLFWATNNRVLYSGPPTTECSILGHQQQSALYWATNNRVLYSGPPTTKCSILVHQQQSAGSSTLYPSPVRRPLKCLLCLHQIRSTCSNNNKPNFRSELTLPV